MGIPQIYLLTGVQVLQLGSITIHVLTGGQVYLERRKVAR